MKKTLLAIALGLSMMTTYAHTQEQYPGFETIHQHGKLEQKRVELAPNVYAFTGYSSSNFAAIKSKNGYILIDTGDDLPRVRQALQEIKQLIPGKLQAILLTHSHPDHRRGAEVFLADADGDIPIYAHHDLGGEQKPLKGLENVVKNRTSKQFGEEIPDELYPENFVIPRFKNGETGKTLAQPNHKIQDGKTELKIDGVKFEITTVAGESPDHLAIYLPEQKVLLTGDHVYGLMPNMYPIRGGLYRDIERWANTVRELAKFDAVAVMPGHNDVLIGKETFQKRFNQHAEAMEYVYNETIKGMNEGKTPNQLAAEIRLPEHLQKVQNLADYYGAIPWAVKEIFAAKLGWFDGNPTNLVPLTDKEEAERMARLAGGKAKLTELAQKALNEKDYRWAAKLTDYRLALSDDKATRLIKAQALEGIAGNILPMSGKTYLIQSAIELKK
ncbi:alkyl/aryl-sulfatase [Muribacter muris]|nr:alkyl/aryl-sulfatase [Muribacter muris]MBF0784240.1 alkyl/aryl-sulfatase [Muribacter muris]MBF0827022.1 alkyl/aryl-sulfatase [Muribacter muris]